MDEEQLRQLRGDPSKLNDTFRVNNLINESVIMLGEKKRKEKKDNKLFGTPDSRSSDDRAADARERILRADEARRRQKDDEAIGDDEFGTPNSTPPVTMGDDTSFVLYGKEQLTPDQPGGKRRRKTIRNKRKTRRNKRKTRRNKRKTRRN